MRIGYFKIRSKDDARYVAKEIQKSAGGLHYETPFGEDNVAEVTIRWIPRRNVFIVSTFGLGWTKRSEMTKATVVDFIWMERKFVNANFGGDLSYRELMVGY